MTDLSVSGLRRAGLTDLDTIVSLEAACFGSDDGRFSRRQLRALLGNPKAYWLINLDGSAMACWLKAGNGRACWARLYSLAVHPHQRGRGFARLLLDAGFEWMKSERLSTCRAEVKAENHTARKLYAAYGFSECGWLRNYYGNGQDGVCLILSGPEWGSSQNVD